MDKYKNRSNDSFKVFDFCVCGLLQHMGYLLLVRAKDQRNYLFTYMSNKLKIRKAPELKNAYNVVKKLAFAVKVNLNDWRLNDVSKLVAPKFSKVLGSNENTTVLIWNFNFELKNNFRQYAPGVNCVAIFVPLSLGSRS